MKHLYHMMCILADIVNFDIQLLALLSLSLSLYFLWQMNMIKVSNIMGVEPKPFDPKTYVEEDTFVTDESGAKKRIRLENNIVRWRTVRNPDGTTSVSNYILL